MKYQYKFATGYETIELDEEWMAVLRELDRVDRNIDFSETKKTIHYDAFGFEPDFMGVEDEPYEEPTPNPSGFFDGSPAFEYAIDHLLPRHREILYRRAEKGEKFKDIGYSYGVSASAIHHYYTKICTRFKKYYEEGLWLSSAENDSASQSGKVRTIPFGLTPAQVMAIRAYRCQLLSMDEISKLVGVPKNRVKSCLRENPILETRCPACGKTIQQVGYGVLQKFCNNNCYYSWFRKNGMDTSPDVKLSTQKERLSKQQQLVLDYYRQNHFTLKQMHIIMGISEQFISAYCFTKPLPYTLCLYCGKQVPGEPGKWNTKYCSTLCRNRYLGNQKKMRKRNGGNVRQRIYPTPEQLEYALILRDECFTFKQIRRMAGLSRQDTDALFRFNKTVVKECRNCKKMFVTEDMQELYCSQKCQDKAKAKRKKKRKKEQKKNDTA